VDTSTLIPIGELRPVDGSDFDLREAKPLDKFLTADGPAAGGDKRGFDHNFCVNGTGMRFFLKGLIFLKYLL
jgi:aldose 1-epimerase